MLEVNIIRRKRESQYDPPVISPRTTTPLINLAIKKLPYN